MGLAKRRLYKPERRAARVKGILYELAPIGCPDAGEEEVAMAVFSMAKQAGFIIGRGSGYDGLRDEYTVVGKSLRTGKVQDVTIAGADVALLIDYARSLSGGTMKRKKKHQLPGLPG